jgi:hypothetical protein
MRAPNAVWTDFFRSIAKGSRDKIQDVIAEFGVTVTNDIQYAQLFFCFSFQLVDF